MSVESIGTLVSTKIPSYSNAADIQQALRIYHYGSESYDPANTSTAALVNPSIAYSLNDLQTQITANTSNVILKSSLTAKGDLISASASSTPETLTVGTNNQILIANNATASGLQWTSTLTSPTINTPVIDTISPSSSSATASLWNTTLTTGSISTGGALTSGGITLAGGTTFAGTIAIANASTSAHTISISNGAGTTNKTINIGTASTGGTTAITLGSTAGATSTIQLNGSVATTSAITTGGPLNLNHTNPNISSNNASVASIFTSTVTGINIGSSTIKTTAFPADGTTSTAAAGEGYMGMPQVVVSSGGKTLAATDAGKHIYVTTNNSQTITIPANTSVALPIGTTVVIVNASGISSSIAINTDTLRLANSTSTGTRSLASNGMCTLVKINSTEWIASGNGLT